MPFPDIPHPCFNENAGSSCGRIHLPVAPDCNVQCIYCNRAYGCINENRPGATEKVLMPHEALERLNSALLRMPYLTVAGIAGPGDAFSIPERTLKTFELIRQAHPRLHLCFSTNGLDLLPHIPALAELGVGFATITINAVDPVIIHRIYTWISIGGKRTEGYSAGEQLLERQLAAVAAMKARGISVKINTVLLPGINDSQMEAVAKTVSSLGADFMNIIGLIPLPGTRFEKMPPSPLSVLEQYRKSAGRYIPQMRHCVRCRSDAAGLLGNSPGKCSDSVRQDFHGLQLHQAPHALAGGLPSGM